jgi:hypothetical protein
LDPDVFAQFDFLHDFREVLAREWFDFNDAQSGLDTFNNFLGITAGRNEVNIIAILVNAVAEYLLALFVNEVHVIENDDFLFVFNAGAGLAESFHFIPVKVDALFFEAVNMHDIVGV